MSENKICTKCGISKPPSEFHRHKRACKSCLSTAVKDWYAKNPGKKKEHDAARHSRDHEKRNATCREYRKLNKEKVDSKIREWKNTNRELVRDNRRKWYSQLNNKSAWTINSANRRALKKHASPSWANQQKIAEFYELASFLAEITGVKFHVDHVVPLRGNTVCGLHVENNLQVLTWKENLEKGNKLHYMAGEL